VYLPLATLPEGFTPQVDPALAAREAADKAAAEELAALGCGPTHIMAMAADSGTRIPPVPNAPGSGIVVPPMGHGQDAQDARATKRAAP